MSTINKSLQGNHLTYTNPLVERYASPEMQTLLSNQTKYSTWRKLWAALASAEKEVGVSDITEEQVASLHKIVEQINFERVNELEAETKHEVFAHIKALAEDAPNCSGIIHLGETSAYVIDNTDIIIARSALQQLEDKLLKLMNLLVDFAIDNCALPTLAFTHFQVAQPTTVGKRAALWLHSFLLDLRELRHTVAGLKLRGVQGTTGTAASFKHILGNNYAALERINTLVAEKFGFKAAYIVTSQTYDRKIDVQVAHVLNQLAVSAHKVTNDLRLLQHLREVGETFGGNQVGSSAMPYKRNPILSERVSSLAKFVMALSSGASTTAATQWLERTLDDSANKRLTLPQMFLAADAILDLLYKIFSSLTVYKEVIKSNLDRELPFLLTENVLMEHVKRGGSRQEGHEIIKRSAMAAFAEVQRGEPNRLLKYLADDPELLVDAKAIAQISAEGSLTGFCEEQVRTFVSQELQPELSDSNLS